jgi:hypothetical protein
MLRFHPAFLAPVLTSTMQGEIEAILKGAVVRQIAAWPKLVVPLLKTDGMETRSKTEFPPFKPGMVAHTCNPSTWEGEAEGS